MTLEIDFQTHTRYSVSCGWTSPERMVRRAEQIGLDGLAITDHNTMNAVAEARQVASDDLLVIPGEEIDTPEGQLIGLFLSDPIEPWQSPRTVIEAIHDQGGVALAPHPFDALREGITTIEAHVDVLDAVEVLNSRCLRTQYNERAQAFASKHGLPATGGSDAHFAHEIGTAYTQVYVDEEFGDGPPGLTAVKAAVQAGEVAPAGTTSTPLVHVGTKAVKVYNWMKQR